MGRKSSKVNKNGERGDLKINAEFSMHLDFICESISNIFIFSGSTKVKIFPVFIVAS